LARGEPNFAHEHVLQFDFVLSSGDGEDSACGVSCARLNGGFPKSLFVCGRPGLLSLKTQLNGRSGISFPPDSDFTLTLENHVI
jgi:hypothetical protein